MDVVTLEQAKADAKRKYRPSTGAVASEAFGGLLSKLRNGTDAVWLNFGDSTSTLTYPWVVALAQRFGAAFPANTARYVTGGSGGWASPTVVSTGSGAGLFTFADAAVGGYASQDWIDHFAAVSTGYTPDVITVMLGHNDSPSLGGSTYRTLVDMIRAQWPNTPVVLCVQDPHKDNDDQSVRRAYIHAYANANGIEVTDTIWRAFGGLDPIDAYYVDSVHPNSLGQLAWKNALLDLIGLATDDLINAATGVTTSLQGQVNALIGGLSTQLSPLTMTTGWYAAYWASDPNWAHPADGAAISALLDGSGHGRNLAQATGTKQPTYRAADATMNGKPAIDFDGGDYLFLDSGLTVALPYTLVLLMAYDTIPASSLSFAHRTSDNSQGLGHATGPTYRLKSGTSLSAGTPTVGKHLIVGQVNSGATDRIEVDGNVLVTGDSGDGTLNQISLGAARNASDSAAAFLDGRIVFAGVYPGDATAASWWPVFKTWARAYYNMTIA